MSLFPEGSRHKRARQERKSELDRIISRLDGLESTQPSTLTQQYIDDSATAIRSGIDGRLESVDARFDGLEAATEDLEEKFSRLTFAVSEGIERTDRAERRIHATIKRARKELASRGFEDPGLESEAEELRLIDGGRGADGEVPPVSESVGAGGEAASSIKGVPASALARARGFA